MTDIHRSQRMKAYWRSPEGKARRKEMRESEYDYGKMIPLRRCTCGMFMPPRGNCKRCGSS